MILLGLLLVLFGTLIGPPVLTTVGIILVVLGVVVLLIGASGHPLAGRRYWF